ncbi:HD domain-containing protein [uncultured Limosilactobacillus sp.]|uniref:HD domain-containing protein n=1 Tax=uncultured Limosilactobacillus sp. TaxID=2837629 RepID=UPI0025E07AE0|nr:HD domain-containing protein [uncultured Limosilactobacillus sp.]
MEPAAQLDAVKHYTIQKLGMDHTGHGLDHIRRVVKMTQRLANDEQVDEFIATAAAYLHDTIDEKLVMSVKEAQEELREFLRKIDFTQQQIHEIMAIITQMSFADTLDGNRPHLSPEGQVVQDADWLDAIGGIGIVRAIYFGGKHSERIYDPDVAPRETMSRDDYRDLQHETIINHFYEKLLKIKPMLNTKAAQKIAEHRQQVMIDFLKEFKDEWNSLR